MQRVPAGLVIVAALLLAGCAKPAAHAAAAWSSPTASATTDAALPSSSPSRSASASPSASVRPSKKPAVKPSATLKPKAGAGGDIPKGAAPAPTSDGTPTHGAGTFTIAPGGTSIVGTGVTLVKYRVELEDGISWGSNAVWTPTSFAALVDGIVADPRGWTKSADAPITDASQHMSNASWSFQRVAGSDYSVRIRLATPDTVDKLCGQYGIDTEGQYSCRYGSVILINLRRWLHGTTGFTDLVMYRNMVINHEMGHLLGFDHMQCPGAGMPAPVMQTQTIALGGCTPNAYPYAADGTFITGPWAAS
jgi:hypothetical protein